MCWTRYKREEEFCWQLPELIFRASHKNLLFTAAGSSALRAHLPSASARGEPRAYGTRWYEEFLEDVVMAHLTAKTTVASKTGAVLCQDHAAEAGSPPWRLKPPEISL